MFHIKYIFVFLSAFVYGNVIATERVPHTTIANGVNSIYRAWFAEPTERYPHGVLGDTIEAGSLFVELKSGMVINYRIPDESVFEDLYPRIADIDQNGEEEVWVVRSDRSNGARLEAYVPNGNSLSFLYATEPIGRGFRWLNPVGIADFNGDGNLEVAYVQTPHIGGILKVVALKGSKLVTIAQGTGFSTHSIGSTHLDLAAIADVDNDGAVEIILPNQSHRELVVISLQKNTLVERWRTSTEKIHSQLKIIEVNGRFTLTYRGYNEDQHAVIIPDL
jgi:hypothetical protein